MTTPDRKAAIKTFRDRRRALRNKYSDASYREAKRWFASQASGVHLADDFTGDPILSVSYGAEGATVSPCIGLPWHIALGPAVLLRRDQFEAEPKVVDRWDVALPDGAELQLIRANAAGDAFESGCTWRELLDRLAVETIEALG